MCIRDRGRPARVHVKIDTGMSRAGSTLADLPELAQALREAQDQGLIAVSYTHLDVYKRQGWRASWVGETDIAYADMPGVNPDGFGCAELEELWDVGVKPQEGGHRPGLKVLELRGEERALTILP